MVDIFGGNTFMLNEIYKPCKLALCVFGEARREIGIGSIAGKSDIERFLDQY